MNKLFPVAISILVMLGAALWLLAPSSFNQYLYSELKSEIAKATATQVEIGRIDTQSLTGQLNSVTAKAANGMQLFYIEQINYSINKKSFKKPPVKITQFSLKGVEITKDPKLLAQVKSSLADYLTTIEPKSLDPEFIIEDFEVHFTESNLALETTKPVFEEGKIARELFVEITKQVLFHSQK